MIELDGSHGEGGGQIVRTALALSTITGKPFRVTRIRANRPRAGLKMQHLTCINALKQLSDCKCEAELGQTELEFYPAPISRHEANIDIKTAGSITLLLQSILLPCILSTHSTRLAITGGTDVKWSMPWDYFTNVFLPVLKPYATIEARLIKRGYYPKGGGKVELMIKPTGIKTPLSLPEQADIYLTDNLVPLLATFSGKFTAESISNHTKSNIYVCEKFLERKIKIEGNIISS
ncbi:RNA 3'-terminal phosphate cyclase [Candidatus Woesearchaeota archaeon]|nr:RNA 3'-terminal phosphate cyclase [Candidatus Woesearchaeota archaeon]